MKNRNILRKTLSLALIILMTLEVFPQSALAQISRVSTRALKKLASERCDFSWVLEGAREPGLNERKTGEWRYVVLERENYVVITGHDNPRCARLTVPATLNGVDVVGIANGALSEHSALETLTLPGNVNIVGESALPKGITLRGYNASYAQSFALNSSFAFESVSKYDFVDGVVDYGDIARGTYIRESQYSIKLRELEASRLVKGTVFFLVDPDNPYSVSYYRVESMEKRDDGYVDIKCETPGIDQIMYNYSGENEAMRVDMESLRLEDGVTAKSAAIGRAKDVSQEFELALKPKYKKKIGENMEVIFEGGLSQKYEVTYAGSIFGTKMLSIKETQDIDVSVSFKAKVDQSDTSPDDMSVKELQRKVNEEAKKLKKQRKKK